MLDLINNDDYKRAHEEKRRGALGDAIDYFTRVISLDPVPTSIDGAAVYLDRASVYHYKGDYDKAIAHYNKVILSEVQSYDHRFEAHKGRGGAYSKTDDIASALEDFDTVIEMAHDHHVCDAYYFRGRFYLKIGDFDSAIKDFDMVIDLKATSKAYYWRGITHYKHGITHGDLCALTEDIEDLTKAIDAKGDFSDAAYFRRREVYKARGEVYEARGETHKAQRDFADAKH